MKMQVINLDKETTLVGDIKVGDTIELTKHTDYFMGKKSSFWRVDYKGVTISSLNRTKAEAISVAKKHFKKVHNL